MVCSCTSPFPTIRWGVYSLCKRRQDGASERGAAILPRSNQCPKQHGVWAPCDMDVWTFSLILGDFLQFFSAPDEDNFLPVTIRPFTCSLLYIWMNILCPLFVVHVKSRSPLVPVNENPSNLIFARDDYCMNCVAAQRSSYINFLLLGLLKNSWPLCSLNFSVSFCDHSSLYTALMSCYLYFSKFPLLFFREYNVSPMTRISSDGRVPRSLHDRDTNLLYDTSLETQPVYVWGVDLALISFQ